MRVEQTEVLLTKEDFENIRDLNIPVYSSKGVNVLPSEGDDEHLSASGQPGIAAEAMVHNEVAGLALHYVTPKWWGFEHTHINDPHRYTMKVLYLNHQGHTSMHYHIDKHETLLVTKGVLTLETIFNKERNYYKLYQGSAWVVPPGYAHRLIAADGPVQIIEASTYDSPSDSIRLS